MNKNLLKGLFLSFVCSQGILAIATEEDSKEQTNPIHTKTKEDGKVTQSFGNNLIEKVVRTSKLGQAHDEKNIPQEIALKLFHLAIQKTLETNKDLRIKRCEVLQALGSQALARGEFLPDISTNIGYGLNTNRTSKTIKDKNDQRRPNQDTNEKNENGELSAALELRQNLFNGGGSIARIQQASNENKAKFEEYKVLEAEMIFRNFQVMLRIITDRILLHYHETNVAIHKEILKAELEKLKVGEVDRTEVALAESKLAKGEARLAEVKISLEGHAGDLERWTGIKADELSLLHPNFSKFLPQTLEELKKIAEKENNRLLAAHYGALAKKASIKRESSGFSPNIDLTLGATTSETLSRLYKKPANDHSFTKDNLTNTSNSRLSVGVQLRVPFDIKGTVRTNVGGARHDYVKTTITGAKVHGDVMASIETDFANLKEYAAIVEAFKRHVKACEIGFQGNLQELAVGAKVYTQVLKAQSDLLDAQEYLIKAKQQYAEASLRLLQNIGRLTAKTFGVEAFNFDPSNPDTAHESPLPQKPLPQKKKLLSRKEKPVPVKAIIKPAPKKAKI